MPVECCQRKDTGGYAALRRLACEDPASVAALLLDVLDNTPLEQVLPEFHRRLSEREDLRGSQLDAHSHSGGNRLDSPREIQTERDAPRGKVARCFVVSASWRGCPTIGSIQQCVREPSIRS